MSDAPTPPRTSSSPSPAASRAGIDSEWFAAREAQYKNLTELLRTTLLSLLNASGIPYLAVTARTKTAKSFAGKAKKPKYTDPQTQILDISAARIVTFVESEADRACELVKTAFKVFPEHSLDKTDELGVDRAGYRSVHFVCEFGPDRYKLQEFAHYQGMRFEIQVRTALQHAWAEIEHDRNYKTAGVLPKPLKRRLNMLAGVLELADREFNTLVAEIDEYANTIKDETRTGKLDAEINSTSLLAYLSEKLAGRALSTTNALSDSIIVISELRNFRVGTLAQLDALLTPEFLDAHAKCVADPTVPGLIRDAMMYADVDRYFNEVWNQSWFGYDPETACLLSRKYKPAVLAKVRAMLNTAPDDPGDLVDDEDDHPEPDFDEEPDDGDPHGGF